MDSRNNFLWDFSSKEIPMACRQVPMTAHQYFEASSGPV